MSYTPGAGNGVLINKHTTQGLDNGQPKAHTILMVDSTGSLVDLKDPWNPERLVTAVNVFAEESDLLVGVDNTVSLNTDLTVGKGKVISSGTQDLFTWPEQSLFLKTFNDVLAYGDAASQLSGWSLTGATLANTDNYKLYWELTDAAGTRTVELFSDAAKTVKVATGSSVGDGAIVLAAFGGSGLTGGVTVVYTGDDTDSGNILNAIYTTKLAVSSVVIDVYYDVTPSY